MYLAWHTWLMASVNSFHSLSSCVYSLHNFTVHERDTSSKWFIGVVSSTFPTTSAPTVKLSLLIFINFSHIYSFLSISIPHIIDIFEFAQYGFHNIYLCVWLLITNHINSNKFLSQLDSITLCYRNGFKRLFGATQLTENQGMTNC